MAEVNVLIEGYAKEIDKGWLASSTVVLIRSNSKIIISDPGCNRKLLLDALRKEKVQTKDVDFVFLSHGHIDHTLLAGIFENARFVTFEGLVYEKDRQLEYDKNILDKDIEVIQTPGHSPEHCSLIVKTKEGIIAVAGDVFWWADGEEQKIDIEKEDLAHPAELDMKKLINSRKTLLKTADRIIPGHGKMFRAER